MPNHSEAEEHLRVIRSLMERSTIYTAISAPTALTGGLLSLVASAVIYYKFRPLRYEEMDAYYHWFLILWLATLALTIASNTFFIWRGARLRSEPFISSGMRLALISLLPSMLSSAFFTFFLWRSGAQIFLPAIWMLCYGVGLLSTSHFAPRSIMLLGWTFLISSFASFWFLGVWSLVWMGPDHSFTGSNLLMGATFGLFHIIYAAFTWPRRSSMTNPGGEP